MVDSIPIFQVKLSEGLINVDSESDKIFGYCIEANKGPVAEPTYVASNSEALRTFGVNMAPHFYQNGAGLVLYRVQFDGSQEPSLTYKAYTENYTVYQLIETEGHTEEFVPKESRSTVDVIKITGVNPGTPKHRVNLSKSFTSNKAYNLTVTIEGVGSKKYQNISSLANVVKKINNKFADYIKAELLVDEEKMLDFSKVDPNQTVTAEDKANKYLVETTDSEGKKKLELKSAAGTGDKVLAHGEYTAARLFYNTDAENVVLDTLSGGSNGKLRQTNGDPSNMEIPDGGLQIGMDGTGTNLTQPNVETTLLYAYRDAFTAMEDVDLLGIATLSNSEVVQNELITHIENMVDPEVAKYRFGVTGLLNYPDKDSRGRVNSTDTIDIDTIADATAHIDNPFIVFIGQGVVFEEDNVPYNLLPHEAVMLYTGLRSALAYNQSIFGGNSRKVLNGVKDLLPITNDGADIYKEDRETLNEAGVMTFLKKYNQITFLQGVTTAHDSPVLSHESIMSIVLYVLRRLVAVAWPFMGETLTEDIKAGFTKALSDELQNIMDTDNSLMPLENYNIPPYDVEIRATTVSGFNEAGELVRETKLLAVIKIVPRGAIDRIELSVVVI